MSVLSLSHEESDVAITNIWHHGGKTAGIWYGMKKYVTVTLLYLLIKCTSHNRPSRLWLVASVWCGWWRFVVVATTAYRALETETTVR